MKINTPRSWPARVLCGGWCLALLGILAIVLLALLAPSWWAGSLLRPLWILSILLTLGTFLYVAAYAVSRLGKLLKGFRGADFRARLSSLHSVEKILVAGWLLLLFAMLVALCFSKQKWVLAFGPETLLWFFAVVIFATTGYASYLLLRGVVSYFRRKAAHHS